MTTLVGAVYFSFLDFSVSDPDLEDDIAVIFELLKYLIYFKIRHIIYMKSNGNIKEVTIQKFKY